MESWTLGEHRLRDRSRDTIGAHRFGNVLQGLSAEIVETYLDLALDVIIGGARDENTARFGHGFEAGRDVDAVTVEIAAFDHDIAEIYADAQDDAAILGYAAVGGRHALLEIDGALHRVDRAGELDQHTVASHLENSALDAWRPTAQHLARRAFRAASVPASSASISRL